MWRSSLSFLFSSAVGVMTCFRISVIWWWWWWWWIVFVVWLTDERRLALFPAGTIVRDPHHRGSPTRREQGLNLRSGLVWMELCSSDNHYTTSSDNHYTTASRRHISDVICRYSSWCFFADSTISLPLFFSVFKILLCKSIVAVACFSLALFFFFLLF